MRAIILAAGRGSRMGNQTADKPKCLTEIAGKTLLQWQLKSLGVAGISDILVVRGYRGDLITGEFEVVDNERWEKTNMAASLNCAASWLEQGPTLVSYSDILYHPDHVRALAACPGELSITADRRWLELWQLRSEDPLSDAETFREEGGMLREIGSRPLTLEDIPGQYMGLLSFTPSGWGALREVYCKLAPEKQQLLDMTSWLKLALEQGIAIQIQYVSGRWCEVDCQADLDVYQEKLHQADRQGIPWSHDWRWS